MREIWKPIPGYEENYKISNKGRIKSFSKNPKSNRRVKILRQRITSGGYDHAALWKNKKMTGFRVHQLVAHVFIGPNPGRLVVHHIDGRKANNRVSNLEYVTYRENTAIYCASKSPKSRHPGIAIDKRTGRFCAKTKHLGVHYYIVSSFSEETAASAYNELCQHRNLTTDKFKEKVFEIRNKYQEVGRGK